MPTDYETLAPTYDRRYVDEPWAGVEETLRRFVGDHRAIRVLEVGCGTGHWLRWLVDRGYSCAGLDASEAMLARARARLPTLELKMGSSDVLPWGDRAFDRLFCVNALHHFPEPERFIHEAARVLRPGGGLLTLGLDPSAGVDAWSVYDYWSGVRESDLLRYAPTERIRSWMTEAGLARCETFVAQHSSIRVNARDALDRGLLDKHTTSQLADLTDEAYVEGVEALRRAIADAEASGRTLEVVADLRLHATVGWAGD